MRQIENLIEPFRFYPGGPFAVMGQIATKAHVSLFNRLEAAGISDDDARTVKDMVLAVLLSRLTAEEALRLALSDEAAALVGEVGEREREYLGQFFRVPRPEGRRNEPKKKGRTHHRAGRVAPFRPKTT